ncbi:MFS transporter [Roseateles saccharophilus]|uniref:Putative MFS family arabinose efflux permease n=1 Tax=Roseateles saccharophilus TaxID=304 RepID=A0A4R3UKC4_ROSSA|nr:MFS transporter [Roseateles saccharophilus]MDG0834441.1 MFS transporter [Roseateles saccharophilus]TCU89847.1 putative MFS family arabinose efflux permease [Roseateles saccharophilus]
MSDAVPSPKQSLRHAFPWLIATLICVHACMATTRVTAALWVLNQGYGEASVGLLLSLFAVAPIVLSLWAGRLADRHGFHRPVGVGVTLAFAGALLALAVQQLWAIAIGCLLCGGAIAVAAVAMQREAGLMADQPGELKRIFSWMALGPALSNSLAPVIAGLLIDHAGMTASFGFATLLPLLAWGLAQKVPRHRPEPRAASHREPAAWDLFRLPAFRRLMLVNLVLSACWDAHSFVVPVVGHARGLSASSIGVVLGSFAVAATCVRLAIVRFADDLDEVRALRTAMVAAMLTFLAYAWLPGTAGLMCGSALLGTALGSVQPMILAMLHHVTPPERHGQALGLRMFAVNGATVAMPAGFGLLAAATALAAPMWLMASLLLLAQLPARRL